jgi:branched-chain amino acid transport system permease protein
MLKQKRTTILIALAIAALVVLVVSQAWKGVPLTVENIGSMLIIGISIGSVYAVSASGLVVTYTTTGIFNFAHGAIGCFLAFMYWELRVNRHWAAIPALIVVILVIAPLIGLVLDRLIMRRLVPAPLVVKLMVTVGLMLLFMGITATMWKPDTGRALPAFFEGSKGFEVTGITVTWGRVITVVVAAGIAVFLRLLLFRTRLGIAMRAVVDNRNLVALNGARPTRVSSFAWMLGCSLAGIAGILIAPETGMVVESLTLIIVIAIAAAAVGQLRSLPLVFLGAMIIGVGRSFMDSFLEFDQRWSFASQGLAPVVLFCAVLLLPRAPLDTGRLKLTQRKERLTTPGDALIGAFVILGLAVAWANGWIMWFTGTNFGERSDVWLNVGILSMIFGVIMLSLVPLTGWAGQVSFANFAIAGFGAVMFSKLGGPDGNALGLIFAAAMCAILGVLIALPALRLQGLYLALLTMAFAEAADKLLFRHPRVINQVSTGRIFGDMHIFGLTIGPGDKKAFLIFVAAVFAVLFLGLEMLRRTNIARRWIAVSDSPAASATIGVNITITKVIAWAVSGAIAGFAGGLLGLYRGSLTVDSFPLFAGLPIVLLLAAQGVRFPIAAFMGALGLMSFPALQQVFGNPPWLSALPVIGPGIAAIAMAFRPEGAVFYSGRDLAPLLPWRKDAREEKAWDEKRMRQQDIRRDEIGEMGLERPFTDEKVAQLDRILAVADELADRPATGDGHVAVVEEEVDNVAPVG